MQPTKHRNENFSYDFCEIFGNTDRQTRLHNVASECGVEDQVVFAGRKSLDEVFALLDEADIYIQPSLQEGLPRSVIEAMSRGCPAIGAKTAGIPELIAPECVVKRKSYRDIAETVIAIANSAKMTELAIQNFLQSKDYLDDVLSVRREEYFLRVLQETAKNVPENDQVSGEEKYKV